MSRLLIACSLVAALTSSAVARPMAPSMSFARPPVADLRAPVPDRIAPTRVLDRAAVRAKLLANRTANLARFRAYQKKGVFPNNTYADAKLNVWTDDAGHLCAAATIIDASGLHDLVRQVAEQNNFIRLADVRQGPVMDWILTSGFTQDEIAMIQEPFMPVAPVEPAPQPILVDAKLRAAEDARLRKRYKQVDAAIVKNQKKSLDRAVDRLMKQPALAWKLLEA